MLSGSTNHQGHITPRIHTQSMVDDCVTWACLRYHKPFRRHRALNNTFPLHYRRSFHVQPVWRGGVCECECEHATSAHIVCVWVWELMREGGKGMNGFNQITATVPGLLRCPLCPVWRKKHAFRRPGETVTHASHSRLRMSTILQSVSVFFKKINRLEGDLRGGFEVKQKRMCKENVNERIEQCGGAYTV